jgi:predicted nucleic acid-binding protein
VADRALVVDASAMVDLLVGSRHSEAIHRRLGAHALHAPAHLDAEVLSALGRLHRAGKLSTEQVTVRLARFTAAPVERHPLAPLIDEAWSLRHNLRLVDALYAALASRLAAPLVTTDGGLAAAFPLAELLTGDA